MEMVRWERWKIEVWVVCELRGFGFKMIPADDGNEHYALAVLIENGIGGRHICEE